MICPKMEERRGHRLISNKLALVILSLVVLELVFISHNQVQPVEAIKKKIYLKKLKKMLPLLALIKPKKKLILVPIPIPMFNKQPHQQGGYGPAMDQNHMMMPMMMNGEGSNPPMSFMMMEPSMTGSVGPASSSPGGMSLMSLPPSSMGMNFESPPQGSAAMEPNMMMPSMTVSIQSDGSGTMSAIELSPSPSRPSMTTSSSGTNNTVSGSLIAGQPSKWLEQQQFNDYDLDEQQFMSGNFINQEPDQQQPVQPQHQQLQQQPKQANAKQQAQQQAGGEHYYSSPWPAGRHSLASPAKLLRNERLKQQPPASAATTTTRQAADQQHRQPVAAPTDANPQHQQHNTNSNLQQQQQTATMAPVSGRLKQQLDRPQQQRKQQQREPLQQQQKPQRSGRQQFSAPMPVLIIRNQWRPSAPITQQAPQQQQQQQRTSGGKSRRQNDRLQELQLQHHQQMPQLTQEQQEQIAQALEQESLVQVGPPQMLPIYQSPSGRLSMTPPTPLGPQTSTLAATTTTSTSSSTTSASPATSTAAVDPNSSFDIDLPSGNQADPSAEVQTVGNHQPGPAAVGANFFRPGSTTTESIVNSPTFTISSLPEDHQAEQATTTNSRPGDTTTPAGNRPMNMPMEESYEMPSTGAYQQASSGQSYPQMGGGGYDQTTNYQGQR